MNTNTSHTKCLKSLNSNRQQHNQDQTRQDNSVFIIYLSSNKVKKPVGDLDIDLDISSITQKKTYFSFGKCTRLYWSLASYQAPVGVSSVSLEANVCHSWKKIYLSVKALSMPPTREASSSFCATSGVQLSWKVYASLCFPRDRISIAMRESRVQSRCLHTGYSKSRILPNTRLNHHIQVSNTNVSLQINLTFGNIMVKCIC